MSDMLTVESEDRIGKSLILVLLRLYRRTLGRRDEVFVSLQHCFSPGLKPHAA